MFEQAAAKPQPGGGSGSSKAGPDGGSAAGADGPSGGGDEQLHSNCIMCVTPLAGGSRFLTSGLDGKVVEWQLEGL